MDNRGKINHKSRSKQIKDYSGLRFGNITPMDIDGFVDFGNLVFAILEYKHVNAPPLQYGQELAIIRLVDNLGRSKPTIAIIAKHDTPSDQEIDCANAIVEKIRFGGKWSTPSEERTVKDVIAGFLKHNKYTWEEPETKTEYAPPIKTKEEYEKIKANVEVLTKKIDEASGWLSEEPDMMKVVGEQQRMAGQMLMYEIENDLLPDYL